MPTIKHHVGHFGAKGEGHDAQDVARSWWVLASILYSPKIASALKVDCYAERKRLQQSLLP